MMAGTEGREGREARKEEEGCRDGGRDGRVEKGKI